MLFNLNGMFQSNIVHLQNFVKIYVTAHILTQLLHTNLLLHYLLYQIQYKQ